MKRHREEAVSLNKKQRNLIHKKYRYLASPVGLRFIKTIDYAIRIRTEYFRIYRTNEAMSGTHWGWGWGWGRAVRLRHGNNTAQAPRPNAVCINGVTLAFYIKMHQGPLDYEQILVHPSPRKGTNVCTNAIGGKLSN